jgi:hypothetical protein
MGARYHRATSSRSAGSLAPAASLAAAVAMAIALGAPRARAQGNATDRQIAQSLFDDGRALLERGDVTAACPKFAESQRLDPGGGTLLNLALCHELEGKTATASNEFREALSLATRDDRKDRQELASLHIAELAPKLTRLMVHVPASIAALSPEVTLDRSRLPAAAWSSAIAVDPGEHHIVVTARGVSRWETSVTTRDEGRTYDVEVPPALETKAPAPMETTETRETRQRSTPFWFMLGGAGLSLATSVITGLMALDANTYVNDNCSAARDFCRVDDAHDAATRARTFAWVSTATLAVGAGAAVVAFVLPMEKRSPLSASVTARDGAAFATLRFTPLSW